MEKITRNKKSEELDPKILSEKLKDAAEEGDVEVIRELHNQNQRVLRKDKKILQDILITVIEGALSEALSPEIESIIKSVATQFGQSLPKFKIEITLQQAGISMLDLLFSFPELVLDEKFCARLSGMSNANIVLTNYIKVLGERVEEIGQAQQEACAGYEKKRGNKSKEKQRRKHLRRKEEDWLLQKSMLAKKQVMTQGQRYITLLPLICRVLEIERKMLRRSPEACEANVWLQDFYGKGVSSAMHSFIPYKDRAVQYYCFLLLSKATSNVHHADRYLYQVMSHIFDMKNFGYLAQYPNRFKEADTLFALAMYYLRYAQYAVKKGGVLKKAVKNIFDLVEKAKSLLKSSSRKQFAQMLISNYSGAVQYMLSGKVPSDCLKNDRCVATKYCTIKYLQDIGKKIKRCNAKLERSGLNFLICAIGDTSEPYLFVRQVAEMLMIYSMPEIIDIMRQSKKSGEAYRLKRKIFLSDAMVRVLEKKASQSQGVLDIAAHMGEPKVFLALLWLGAQAQDPKEICRSLIISTAESFRFNAHHLKAVLKAWDPDPKVVLTVFLGLCMRGTPVSDKVRKEFADILSYDDVLSKRILVELENKEKHEQKNIQKTLAIAHQYLEESLYEKIMQLIAERKGKELVYHIRLYLNLDSNAAKEYGKIPSEKLVLFAEKLLEYKFFDPLHIIVKHCCASPEGNEEIKKIAQKAIQQEREVFYFNQYVDTLKSSSKESGKNFRSNKKDGVRKDKPVKQKDESEQKSKQNIDHKQSTDKQDPLKFKITTIEDVKKHADQLMEIFGIYWCVYNKRLFFMRKLQKQSKRLLLEQKRLENFLSSIAKTNPDIVILMEALSHPVANCLHGVQKKKLLKFPKANYAKQIHCALAVGANYSALLFALHTEEMPKLTDRQRSTLIEYSIYTQQFSPAERLLKEMPQKIEKAQGKYDPIIALMQGDVIKGVEELQIALGMTKARLQAHLLQHVPDNILTALSGYYAERNPKKKKVVDRLLQLKRGEKLEVHAASPDFFAGGNPRAYANMGDFIASKSSEYREVANKAYEDFFKKYPGFSMGGFVQDACFNDVDYYTTFPLELIKKKYPDAEVIEGKNKILRIKLGAVQSKDIFIEINQLPEDFDLSKAGIEQYIVDTAPLTINSAAILKTGEIIDPLDSQQAFAKKEIAFNPKKELTLHHDMIFILFYKYLKYAAKGAFFKLESLCKASEYLHYFYTPIMGVGQRTAAYYLFHKILRPEFIMPFLFCISSEEKLTLELHNVFPWCKLLKFSYTSQDIEDIHDTLVPIPNEKLSHAVIVSILLWPYMKNKKSPNHKKINRWVEEELGVELKKYLSYKPGDSSLFQEIVKNLAVRIEQHNAPKEVSSMFLSKK